MPNCQSSKQFIPNAEPMFGEKSHWKNDALPTLDASAHQHQSCPFWLIAAKSMAKYFQY